MNFAQWKDIASATEQFAASVGILGGGVWAYFKYLRGRTFSYRAELSIDYASIEEGAYPNVSARLVLVNRGLSKIPFAKGLKVVKLYALTEPKWVGGINVKWGEALILVPLFEHHDWIEPGETITEAVLIPVPTGIAATCLAYKITVDVFGAPRQERGSNVSWFAEDIIVVKRSDEDAQPHHDTRKAK